MFLDTIVKHGLHPLTSGLLNYILPEAKNVGKGAIGNTQRIV